MYTAHMLSPTYAEWRYHLLLFVKISCELGSTPSDFGSGDFLNIIEVSPRTFGCLSCKPVFFNKGPIEKDLVKLFSNVCKINKTDKSEHQFVFSNNNSSQSYISLIKFSIFIVGIFMKRNIYWEIYLVIVLILPGNALMAAQGTNGSINSMGITTTLLSCCGIMPPSVAMVLRQRNDLATWEDDDEICMYCNTERL